MGGIDSGHPGPRPFGAPAGAGVQNGSPAVVSNRRVLIKPPFPPIKRGPEMGPFLLAEREGFEPSMGFWPILP
jgi:hypothetical protein